MARIDHTHCTHPRTPAGRAACRKAGGVVPQRRETHHPRCTSPAGHNTAGCPVPPGTPTIVVPIKRGGRIGRVISSEDQQRLDDQLINGVHPQRVKRRKTTTVNAKRPGTHLRTIGDLPDVPRMLAHGCRMAWDLGWPVVVGHSFNDQEKRIVITGDLAEIALVWKPSNPHGVWGVFVRKHRHPITHRVEGVNEAFRMAKGEDPLPE